MKKFFTFIGEALLVCAIAGIVIVIMILAAVFSFLLPIFFVAMIIFAVAKVEVQNSKKL